MSPRRMQLNAERRAAGICVRCGIDASPPGKRCAFCREVARIKRPLASGPFAGIPLWPSAFGAA